MTKVRKQKRRKQFNHGKNRKRMNTLKLPVIKCSTLNKSWDPKKSAEKNMKTMGLVYNVNKQHGDEGTSSGKDTHVLQQLRGEVTALRHRPGDVKLPRAEVSELLVLLDKYGDDYRAMAADKSNHLQRTWRQMRARVLAYAKRINVKTEESTRSTADIV